MPATREILAHLPANSRMAVRVVNVPARTGVYQVQYEVGPGKWRNLSTPDGRFFYQGLHNAKMAARRCHNRNNG